MRQGVARPYARSECVPPALRLSLRQGVAGKSAATAARTRARTEAMWSPAAPAARLRGSLPPALVGALTALVLFALCACGDDDDEQPIDSAVGRGGDQGNGHGGSGARDGGTEPDGSAADASQPAPACDVVAPTSCPEEPPYADVQAIVEKRCVGCHNGKGDEWALTSQAHVAIWYIEIRAAMSRCTMPPPASGLTMPTEERELILQWLRCNF